MSPGEIFLQARSEPFVPLFHDFLALAGDCNRAAYLGLAFFWQRGAGYGEWVEKSSTDFADVLHLSSTTQERIRSWLKDLGLLEQKRTKEIPTRCLWRLDLDELARLVAPNWGVLGGPKLGSPSITKKKKEVLVQPTPKRGLFEGVEEPQPVKSGPLTKAELAEFEEWYRAYPKKIAKGGGRTAWRKARAQFPAGSEGLAQLVELTRSWWARRRAVEGPSLQYVPGPGPWLNQERWLDEHAAQAQESPDDDLAHWREGALARHRETQRMLREQRGE